MQIQGAKNSLKQSFRSNAFDINHQHTISAVAITAGERKFYPKKQQQQTLLHTGRKTTLNALMKEICEITTCGFDQSQNKGKYTWL